MSLESLDRAVKGTIDLSVGDIIAKYGTTPAIAMAVQRGEIKNVTNAVMAGMAIDRIAANALKPPTTTVAQDTLPMGQAPQTGVAAAQQMQGQPAGAGLDQIPISEGMFTAANGGIVAFEDGGSTMFTGSPLGSDVRGLAQVSPRIPSFFSPSAIFFNYMTDEEKEKYQTTGVVPEAAKKRYQNSANTQGAQAQLNENIIAQAQRGEGPNVSRPAAPADAAVVPSGGPVIPRPTGVEAVAAPTSVVKKPEAAAKPLSIFDEASNAANKLQAYKTQFGVGGADPDAAMRDKLKQLQEGTKEERREAAYMAMIMAGLGIAGGTSPYAAVNLKEAIPALKEYGVAKRDIKKADMEYTKMETEINRAAEARKRGDMELAFKLEESAADRDLKLRQVIAAERAASKPSQLRELIDLAAGGDQSKVQSLAEGALKGKSGSKPMSQYERARLQQVGMKNASDEIRNNRQISRLANSKDPKDKAEAERLRNEIIAKHMQSASGGSNLGGAVFVGYGDE